MWLILGFSISESQAQRPEQQFNRTGSSPIRTGVAPPVLGDSTRPRRDTTVSVGDTLKQKGDLETTVKYSANDSMVLDVVNKVTRLYGQARVTYGEVVLEADEIELNYLTNIVNAKGSKDSTGKTIGLPVFQDGAGKYNADEIRYNFKTKKAIIKGVVTQQGEGFIQGQQVKKDPEDNLYIRHAIYTTCNLKHPHWFIDAGKIKVVHNTQIVTGPFNLVIADIPTPLGFAFGLFPFTKKRSSGIIVPTYGEESSANGRGFYLRNGGYYWAVNQYLDLHFLGEIYSKGGWGASLLSTYRKRYRFDGSFAFRYNKRRAENTQDASITIAQDFWIDWSHRPVARGLSSFSASVSAGTSTYNARNSFDYNNYLSNTFRSAISYSTSVRGTPFRTAISLQHDQNTSTKVVNLTLPQMTLNMNRIYPFRGKNSTGRGWWETVNVGFDMTGGIRLSNAPRTVSGFPFQVLDDSGEKRDTAMAFTPSNFDELLRRAQIGATYTIPVSASLKLLKYFSFNPSFNLQGAFYPYKMEYKNDVSAENPDLVKVDTVRRLATPFSYSFSAGITTRIYGTYNLKGKKVQAIRHTIIPSIGLSYSPDFSNARYGYYQRVRINRQDVPHNGPSPFDASIRNYRLVSQYQGFQPGVSLGSQVGSISFSLNNTVEAKVRNKNDSTGKKFEKVSLLNALNLSTSYNLLAEEFNLSNINLSANTRFLKTFDVNFSSTIDPYIYVTDTTALKNPSGIRLNRYAFQEGRGLGQIAYANIGISTSFRPGGNRKTDQARKDRVETVDGNPIEKAQILANPGDYVDFNVPWSLNISYSFNYSKPGLSESKLSQTLSFNGDVSLTEKWKLSFNSGYDFVNKGISYTMINIVRDLHCWEMTLGWAPFGGHQYYQFNLHVKSSILRDLKLTKQRTFYDSNAIVR